jgi:hypothetical protein
MDFPQIVHIKGRAFMTKNCNQEQIASSVRYRTQALTVRSGILFRHFVSVHVFTIGIYNCDPLSEQPAGAPGRKPNLQLAFQELTAISIQPA